MTDKEKIKAEIERLKKEVMDDEYWHGYDAALNDILYFINSLEEPKDKCKGCNNVKGCITCVDGSEWAHYEEVKEPIHRTQEEIDAAMQEVEEKIKAFSAAYPNGFQLPSEEAEHTCDLETEIDNYIGHPQEADEDASITAIRQAARHFAKWQKEQIMKGAVDLVIEDASFVNLQIEGIKKDDKVKVIILKEE